MQIFKERIAEPCVNTPIFVQQLLRNLLYHYDRNRDQRHADQKDHARFQAHPAEDGEQRERCEQAVKQLRQILSKVCFELLHTFGGHLYDL